MTRHASLTPESLGFLKFLALGLPLAALSTSALARDCSIFRDYTQRAACEREDTERALRERQAIRDQHQRYYQRDQSEDASPAVAKPRPAPPGESSRPLSEAEVRAQQQRLSEAQGQAAREQAQALGRRQLIVARLNAQATTGGRLSERDYEGLILTAYPEADLMVYWARQAAQQYGGRFRMLLGLSLGLNCPGRPTPDQEGLTVRQGLRPDCDLARLREGATLMHDYLGEATPQERLLICAQDDWRNQYVRDQRSGSEWNPLAALSEQLLATCKARLGEMAASADAFNQAAGKVTRQSLQPALVFFNPDRLRGQTDPASVEALFDATNLAQQYKWVPMALEDGEQNSLQRDAARRGRDIGWATAAIKLPVEPGPISLARGKPGQTAAGVAPLSREVKLPPRLSDVYGSFGELQSLATGYVKLKRYGEALAYQEAALEIANAYPDKVPGESLGRLLHQMGYLFSMNQQPALAEKFFRESVVTLDKRLAGKSAPDWVRETLVASLAGLAAALDKQSRPGEAETYLQRRLDETKTLYGPCHGDVAWAGRSLAGTQEDLPGKEMTAIRNYQAALDCQTQVERKTGVTTTAQGYLAWRQGVVHRGLGHSQEAEAAFDEALVRYRAASDARPQDIALVYESKMKLFTQTNQRDKLAQAKAAREAVLAGKPVPGVGSR